MKANKPYLVGVAGGSGSGKTFFVDRLKERIDNDLLIIIPLDDYYKDSSHKPFEEREKQNYDHPDAFDKKLLVEQLTSIKNRQSILKPKYDFKTHTRFPDKIDKIDSHPVVILEGILSFAFEEVRQLLDLKIFINTPNDIRIIRRIARDTKERGRSLDSVIEQYKNSVRPMHLAYVEPTKEFADIIISGERYSPEVVEMVAKQCLKNIIK
ncbi:MAG: uridine kinase [Ignavibacteria bacterium]